MANNQFKQRILFYNDAAAYGGHEAMTVQSAIQLSAYEDFEVGIMFFQDNSRMRAALLEASLVAPRLWISPTPFASGSIQGFRSLVARQKIDFIAKEMRAFNPDVVIVAQGTIEISTMGVLAARQCRVELISYIPNGHTVKFMKGILGGLRDSVNRRFYYSLPKRFITVSESAKNSLVERGVSPSRIGVAYSGIDFSRYRLCDRSEARRTLSIADEDYVVGILGRISFRDKGQDIALKMLSSHRHLFPRVKFLIVGEGPDRDRLISLTRKLRMGNSISVMPWLDDLSTIYSALDALAIPSRLEGVPLVMLEAMYYSLPIVATNIDGMAEFLPREWLFPSQDLNRFANTLATIRAGVSKAVLSRNKKIVLEVFSLERFKTKLRSLVLTDSIRHHGAA